MLLRWLTLLRSAPYRSLKHNAQRAEERWNHKCVFMLWDAAGAASLLEQHGLFCASSIRTPESCSLKPKEVFCVITTDLSTQDCSPTSMPENFSSIFVLLHIAWTLCLGFLEVQSCQRLLGQLMFPLGGKRPDILKGSGYGRECLGFLWTPPPPPVYFIFILSTVRCRWICKCSKIQTTTHLCQ